MEVIQLQKILGEYPLFRGLSLEVFSDLIAGHRFRNLRHHEALYEAGDLAHSFAIVLTGAFKLVRKTPNGEDVIVYFATPGDVIGGLVMLKPEGVYPISVVAMGNSTVLVLPRATYVSAWVGNAMMQSRLTSSLYSRMTSLQDDKANSKLSLQKRVAALLLTLLDKNEQKGSRLPIPLTRQEIADSVGATVESVIRCMSELSQLGLVRTEDRQIEILRADRIAEILKEG